MEDKLKRGKKVLLDKLEMPKEIVLDVPRITVIGRNEITIENHKGILVFEKNEIKIKTSLDPLIIKGNSFEILYIATSTLIISGYFDYIGYGEWYLRYGRDKKRKNKSWNTSKRYRKDFKYIMASKYSCK